MHRSRDPLFADTRTRQQQRRAEYLRGAGRIDDLIIEARAGDIPLSLLNREERRRFKFEPCDQLIAAARLHGYTEAIIKSAFSR